MGFSDDHMKTLIDHTLRKASSIFFATRPEADIQADVDSAFREVQNGSTDSVANVLQNYADASDNQLMKKTDCKECPPCVCPPPPVCTCPEPEVKEVDVCNGKKATKIISNLYWIK